ncbi:hypothetical protein [Neobacillus soli]|uniref:hypothetical protein n=1 Tax=Neobacillus soli TaxID=220688 RepID=UPI000824559F|nr:hypothetical protein [Neobacillus soli]
MEKEIMALLQQMNGKLDNLEGTLKEHSGILKEYGETLKEHSRMLSALRTGQEFNKAELSEMKLQNAKDLGENKEHLKSQEDSIELLLKNTWKNKEDILKIQKILGLS